MSRYNKALEKLMDNFYENIQEQNLKHGTTHGFIGLMIRDESIGNIDIMHNCVREKDIIKVLELVIQQLKGE